MTPTELLEMTKARVSHLLFDDNDKLTNLLRVALRKYQTKAGVVLKKTIHQTDIVDGCFSLPEHHLGRVSLASNTCGFVRHEVDVDKVIVHPDDLKTSSFPLKYSYFFSLANVDLVTYQLPESVIDPIGDYLLALIKVPNNLLIKITMESGGFAGVEVEDESTLQTRIQELEAGMKTNRAIAQMVSL